MTILSTKYEGGKEGGVDYSCDNSHTSTKLYRMYERSFMGWGMGVGGNYIYFLVICLGWAQTMLIFVTHVVVLWITSRNDVSMQEIAIIVTEQLYLEKKKKQKQQSFTHLPVCEKKRAS